MNRSGNGIIHFMFMMLMLSAVLNGSAFWLKRVGWYEPQLHRYSDSHFVTGMNHHWTDKERKQYKAFTARIYQSHGGERLLKLAKFLWIAAFIAISLLLLRRSGAFRRQIPPWPLLLFIGLVLIGGAQAMARFGPAMLAGGIRFFLFLFIACLGYWAVRRESLNFLAQCLLLFIVFQLLLCPIEVRLGVPVFGTYYGTRAAGTMLQPSSLGLMTVVSLLFYMQFSTAPLWRTLLLSASTFAIVLYTKSASALLLLLLLLVAKGYLRLPQRVRIGTLIASGAVFILFIVFLPSIMHRNDVFESLWGRLFTFENYIDSLPNVAAMIFGQGLGVGTNSALNLMINWQGVSQASLNPSILFVADSTPLALLAQLGIVGVVSFYLLLAIAARRDARAAPLYLAIAIASLNTIVAELFPLNVLLGLLLARSFFLKPVSREALRG